MSNSNHESEKERTMNIIFAFIAGAAALAAWQIYRGKKNGLTLKEAAKVVIFGGGGPGSGEHPK